MDMAQDMVMPVEHGAPTTMAESETKAGTVHVVAAACTHRACDQGSTFTSVKPGADRTQLRSVQWVAIDAIHVPILSVRSRVVEPPGEPPPLGSVSPLSLSLRI